MAPRKFHKFLSIKDKIIILNQIRKCVGGKTIALQYGVDKSTISQIKRNERKIRQFAANAESGPDKRKTLRTTELPKMEQALYRWFLEQRKRHAPISASILAEKARQLIHKFTECLNFTASSGWIDNFKKRHRIRLLKICGEKLSNKPEHVGELVDRFNKKIAEMNLTFEQCYNADESRLFGKLLPEKTLAHFKETNAPGRKASKERITFMPCTNASGNHKLKLLVIRKAQNRRAFKNMDHNPVEYRHSKNVWMTTAIFKFWFHDSFVPQLSEIVNSISPQGQLPLGMALLSRSSAIAQTLVKNGSADVNAYDAEGCTLLIDAVKRGDGFSAKFLLDKSCNVNLTSRSTKDTALHLVCTYADSTSDPDTYKDMLEVGKRILEQNADVNVQNFRGFTPLHLAIVSGHKDMIDMLLENQEIDLNIRTIDEKCALQLSLTPPQTDGPPFELARRLIENGARPNQLNSETCDNLLQILALNKLEEAAVFLAEHGNLNHVNAKGLSALHIASDMGLAKLVRKLLEKGASPNLQSSIAELKTAIHFAVERDSLDVLKEFVEFKMNDGTSEKPDFNAKNGNGDSPLSLALSLNKNELVPILIQGGADVNARNGQDMTLLHQAILNQDDETAVFLLNQGADMNALTADQESPLQLAIHCRLPKVVDALCTRGVSFSSPDNKGDPPLWTALDSDQEDVAQVLVRHGVDTDCWGPGPEGCLQTLLHRAIDENKENAAVFLIKSGCDLDSPRQPGPHGQGADEAKEKASPLHLCCQWGLIKVLQTLIDHGANINSLDCDNKTPLHVAIENQHSEIIAILLYHPGIDLEIRDKSGNTPFAAALTVRNHKAAQNILERLPNAAEQMDQRGRNFLHTAIMKDDLESVLFLLAIHVDVNSRVRDVNLTPPLHLAAASKNEMIVRNLILAGARINERDATQKTALHIAAERGQLAAVSALVQNGANFDAVDSDGNNALHIAVRESHLSIVRELLTESSINAETANLKGRNPLHELCRSGKDNTAAAICELFIECMPKYPINEVDTDFNTPLLLAFMRGQAPLCKVLVKNGACLGAENKDGVTIFNFKLATDQLLHKLLDQLPQESPWAVSEMCQECGTKFTITMRKHHCRHCGRILCSRCSNNDVPIIKFGINKPVRVCSVCFEVLQVGSG